MMEKGSLLNCVADDLKISGSVDGLSKILHTRGSCDIEQVLHSSCVNFSGALQTGVVA